MLCIKMLYSPLCSFAGSTLAIKDGAALCGEFST